MRKVMLLAAMLAMVLAAAAPAFGQATAVEYGDDTDNSVNVNDSICTNVVQIAADQYSAGDQNAASVEGDATNIANELGISVTQVNNCFNTYGIGGGITKTVYPTGGGGGNGGGGTISGGGGSADVGSSVSAASEEGGSFPASEESGSSAPAAAAGELPETGGASVLALGTGVLLVAGGLVARRVVR